MFFKVFDAREIRRECFVGGKLKSGFWLEQSRICLNNKQLKCTTVLFRKNWFCQKNSNFGAFLNDDKMILTYNNNKIYFPSFDKLIMSSLFSLLSSLFSPLFHMRHPNGSDALIGKHKTNTSAYNG